MDGISGVLSAASFIGVQAILIKPSRMINDIPMQVTIEEMHEDLMEITEQPVEVGGRITDNSFVRPATLTVHCGWSNSPSSPGLLGGLASAVTGTIGAFSQLSSSLLGGTDSSQVRAIYDQLQLLQQSRIPFTVVTGKRIYNNMLMKSLKVTTNKDSENSLLVTATFQQILMVYVSTLSYSAATSDQTYPESTDKYKQNGQNNLVAAPTYNAGAGRGVINPTLAGLP